MFFQRISTLSAQIRSARERYVFVLPLREIDIFLYGKSTAVSLQQNDNFVVSGGLFPFTR